MQRKSKSEEELSKSTESSTYELSGNTTGLPELQLSTASGRTSLSSSFEITPPVTPNKGNLSPSLDQRPPRNEILQLNEETNTWKITPKRQRKSGMNRGRKNLHSSIVKLQSYLKYENADEFRFRTVVAFLFFSILVLVLLTRYMHYHREINLSISRQIYLHKNARKISFIHKDGSNLLHINYGLSIPSDIQPVNCRSISSQSNILCLDWKYRAHLSVKSVRETFNNETVNCYKFRWQSYEKYSTIKDCFDMTDSHWYGTFPLSGG